MTTPEGWYPHPDDEMRLRFWDGEAFTDERVWDGNGWAAAEASADTVTPPPFDMERVTLTIVDDDMEPIPPDQLVAPPPPVDAIEVPLPPPPADTTALPLPPPPANTTALPLPPPPANTTALPPPPGRPGGHRTAWFIAAAVIVALFSAGATYLFVNRDSGEIDAESAATTADESSSSDGGSESDGGSGSSGERPTTTSTTTTLRTTTTTTLPTTAVPAGPVNSWVVVLASVENASGAAAAQQRLAEVRSFAPGAQMLASDGFASLRPGYQVIYLTGYASPDATVSACRGFGLNVPNQCYGRYLSQNPADQDKVAMG